MAQQEFNDQQMLPQRLKPEPQPAIQQQQQIQPTKKNRPSVGGRAHPF
jgi:hypothetical protein